MRNVIAAAALTALLGACATMPAPGAAGTELAQLEAECTSKGGILVANSNQTSARDRANYTCDIKQGSRVSRKP